MKTYLVGGAVRDTLLGLPVKDRDWVVVGATPAQMTALGFKPVGKDFPVFLHPVTHEEHALARTERKTAPGYRGFSVHAAPDVTLQEDLARRDITINSIAVDAIQTLTNGTIFSRDQLVDPYGGQNDLNRKVLRHVTVAFREDPVRVLRVARFAARFSGFEVAPETLALMRDMVQSGEMDALVPERIWQELSHGLMENKPSRMLDVLAQAGALARLMAIAEPGQSTPAGPAPWALLDQAAQDGEPLPVRAALLLALLRVNAQPLPRGLSRLPRDCQELAKLLAQQFEQASGCDQLDAAQWVQWLLTCDAFRRPGRFLQFMRCCELLLGRNLPGAGVLAAAQTARLPELPPAGQLTGDIAGFDPQVGHSIGPEIGIMLNEVRTRAVAGFLG